MNEEMKRGSLRCVEGGLSCNEPCQEKTMDRVLNEYDVTQLVGLSATVCGAAILNEAEGTVEVPKLQELMAAVAVARCLLPIKLRGHEIKAIRKIMKCTLSEFAKKLDDKTAPETVSRWESEAQPMGGYAEKILRLVACESLKHDAPGVEYNAALIAAMIVMDPWRVEAGFKVPPIVLSLVRIKELSGAIIDAWDLKDAA
jgi:DNA-binding transcriptional regulator YiaG